MRRRGLFVLLFFSLVIFLVVSPFNLLAQNDQEIKQKYEELNEKIDQYQQKLAELRVAKKTLANQVAMMDSQIKITSLKIEQTQEAIRLLEEQIKELSLRINQLDLSLNQLSLIFLDRVVATYKSGRLDPLYLFLSSDNFADFFRRLRYLRMVQLNDRQVMLSLEEARTNYDRQKEAKEEKQRELELLKNQLDQQKRDLLQQKKDKEHLLALTRNDEIRYQQLLSQALAELEAIQAIVAGQGEESRVGEIKKGEKIATVINVIKGSLVCSTGTHLHFEIRKEGKVVNPFSYLSPIQIINDSGGDEYSFGGSWPWPLNPPIKLTQGFGSNTWWIRSGLAPYKFHTGVDLVSDDLTVKSVADGILYNGSVTCGKGKLRYVRVEHQEEGISTYYLHVNYAKL